jgi:hypothetical protein
MKSKCLAVLVALIAFSRLASADPTVEVVGNLPATGAGVVINNDAWLAESFTVPTGQRIYQISEIEVGLERVGHPLTKSYGFRIYTNLNDKPGRIVGSFGIPNFNAPVNLDATADFSGTFDLSTSRAIYLSAGQTYWLVAFSTNRSSTDDIAWITTTSATDPSGLSGASLGSTILQSIDESKTWTSFSGGVPSIRINAVCQ